MDFAGTPHSVYSILEEKARFGDSVARNIPQIMQ
jgi:hypothetical protein